METEASSSSKRDVASADMDDSIPASTLANRPAGMSKNAHKRMLKAERNAKHRPIWKQQEKEKRKAKKLRKSAEQPAKKAAAKEPRPRQKVSDANVIIDCGFDDLMTDKEIISMTGQLSQLYSSNRKAQRPFGQIVISGKGDCTPQEYAALAFDVDIEGSAASSSQQNAPTASSSSGPSLHDGRIGQRYKHSLQDMWQRWHRFHLRTHGGLEKIDQDLVVDGETAGQGQSKLEALCDKSEMIYLTADTEDTLDRIEEGKTYIIGGIVDRNRHKNLCAKKARALGIRTARLPIPPKYLKTSSVMTINQVLAILLTYNETQDWTTTLDRCLPTRKRADANGTLDGEAVVNQGDQITLDSPDTMGEESSEQGTEGDVSGKEDELYNT